MKILAIDDEPFILELIEDYLNLDNFKVTTTSDASAFLKKFNENKFDMLLVDLMMPNISGLDLIKASGSKMRRCP